MDPVSAEDGGVATPGIVVRILLPHFDQTDEGVAGHMIDLDEQVNSLVGGEDPFAFCGIGIARQGRSAFYTATAAGFSATEDSIFRVASVSKIVTAAVLENAAKWHGIDRPYGVDAGSLLEIDLRHPAHPNTPVTLGMLMTHTSGLTDDAGYGFDGTIAAGWDARAMFGPNKPGTYFSYSNLGYILLAAAAEVLSGRRFDVLVADMLRTKGITGGVNWAGLNDEARARFLPTYRRDGLDFVAMIDQTWPAPFGAGDDYELGAHTARFSPQGGLRTSLRGMLGLAQVGAGVPRDPLWRMDDGGGDYLDGLFQDYGAGEQILPAPPFYPRPLVGHFGNAYGFNGGVWHDEQAGLSFAYALNGVAMGDESDALSNAELRIFDAIAQAA